MLARSVLVVKFLGGGERTTHLPHSSIALIERSQLAQYPKIYEKGAFQALTDTGGSWL